MKKKSNRDLIKSVLLPTLREELTALRLWQQEPELTDDLANGIAISISKVEAAIGAAERNKRDAGKLHIVKLSDEELDAMIRALTFAADFQADYYTLYPGDDYNSGNARKQAQGERILADLRATLGDSAKQEATK